MVVNTKVHLIKTNCLFPLQCLYGNNLYAKGVIYKGGQFSSKNQKYHMLVAGLLL